MSSAGVAYRLLQAIVDAILKTGCRTGHAIEANWQIGDVVNAGGRADRFAMKASGKLNGNDMCARKPPAGRISHCSTQSGEIDLRQAGRRHQAYD
jgi:hypothetical protein